MVKKQFDVAKGNKDWFGKDAILRNKVRDTLRNIFESYGYNPLETPLVEDKNALAFKGGGEIQKEVFQLRDQGGRSLALRFDQTVPLARFVACHPELRFPFKRYAIGPVFRDGPTQPDQGRYRSFTQCDVDILGVKEMSAEAELFALAQDAFEALGLGGVDVKINNRKLLDGILDHAGVLDHAKLRTIVTLDKMDKIGEEGVMEDLTNLTLSDGEMSLTNDTLKNLFKEYDEHGVGAVDNLKSEIETEVGEDGFREIKGFFDECTDKQDLFDRVASYTTKGSLLLNPMNVNNLMAVVGLSGTNDEVYLKLEEMVKSEKGKEGLREVRQLLDYSKSMGFDFIRLDPSLARGLDYYTGTTIEVYLKDRNIVNSAILAGGRFDDMVGDFRGGEDIPAVGFSFGLERLAMILKSQGQAKETNTQIYIIPMGTTDKCLEVAHRLRGEGVKVDMELRSGIKLKKSITYADAQGIPFIGIVGDNEIESGTVAIKNLRTKEKSQVKFEDVSSYLSR